MVDRAVQIGGVIQDFSEAAGDVDGDGGGVVTADMGINLFHCQRFQGGGYQFGGVSPAPVVPVGLETFQKITVLPLLQPQSGYIAVFFLPNAANAIREKVIAEEAVEILAFLQGEHIIDLRQGKYP